MSERPDDIPEWLDAYAAYRRALSVAEAAKLESRAALKEGRQDDFVEANDRHYDALMRARKLGNRFDALMGEP